MFCCRSGGTLKLNYIKHTGLEPVVHENIKRDYETALEWAYKVRVTEWLNIQPDVQYAINPGGTGDIKYALVLGFQLGVSM